MRLIVDGLEFWRLTIKECVEISSLRNWNKLGKEGEHGTKEGIIDVEFEKS